MIIHIFSKSRKMFFRLFKIVLSDASKSREILFRLFEKYFRLFLNGRGPRHRGSQTQGPVPWDLAGAQAGAGAGPWDTLRGTLGLDLGPVPWDSAGARAGPGLEIWAISCTHLKNKVFDFKVFLTCSQGTVR